VPADRAGQREICSKRWTQAVVPRPPYSQRRAAPGHDDLGGATKVIVWILPAGGVVSALRVPRMPGADGSLAGRSSRTPSRHCERDEGGCNGDNYYLECAAPAYALWGHRVCLGNPAVDTSSTRPSESPVNESPHPCRVRRAAAAITGYAPRSSGTGVSGCACGWSCSEEPPVYDE
jgi:hypothetical protein